MTIKSQLAQQLLILAILTIALVFRFRYLTEIEHNVDHAYTVWQAMTTLDRGEFPLAGQGTSVLFANPPLTGYLFIPAVALTRSPLGVYIFVIALNTLAVWMTYRATGALLGRAAGSIAAALMAVNPWVIEYSRTSWVQSLLPFFVCAVAWLLWPVLTNQAKRPARRLALALVMTALLTQTYLLAYFILLPVAVLLLIFRRHVPRRGLLIGGSVIILTTGLYGIGLLGQIETVQARINDFGSADSRLSLEAWNAASRLVTGADYESARGVLAPADDSDLRRALSQPASFIVMLVLLGGVGVAVYALWRDESPIASTRAAPRDAAVILLVWFGLPILAMSYTGNPIHSFYQLLGFPAGYGLTAWGLVTLFRPAQSRIGAVALGVLFVPFAALMLTNSARYYQETEAIPGVHGLSALPVDRGLAMRDIVEAELDAGGVVYAQAPEWIINSFAGRLFPVLRDTRAPAYNAVPRDGGLYISIGEGQTPTPHLAEGQTILEMPDSRLSITTLPPAAQAALPGQLLEIPSQQGLTLLAYDLGQAGDRHTLLTIWRVDSIGPEVPGRIYSPFLHLYNDAGERVLNIDGEGLPGSAWRVGDWHVHRMTFTLPPDASTLLVGQFDGLNNANIVFLPPDAEPTVAVELPFSN